MDTKNNYNDIMSGMPKIIKYPLAGLGVLVIIVAVNIALGTFYFNSYRAEVSKIITSYIGDVMDSNYDSAYSHFSQKIQKQTPYNKFRQGLEFSIRDSGDFNKDYKITYESFGNALGTAYIGPQATYRVKLSQQKVETINEFTLIRENDTWKIDDIQVYVSN